MSDPFFGQIQAMPYSFAPLYWSFCWGQSMAVSQNQALYALVGNQFGGDTVNFLLPDLRGRVLRGAGAATAGTSSVIVGQKAGAEQVALVPTNLPQHLHPASFAGTGGSAGTPLSVAVAVQASTGSTGNAYVPSTTNKFLAGSPTGGTGAQMWATSLSNPAVELGGVTATVSGGGGGITGGTVTVGANTTTSAPMSVLNPSLGMNFCIAIQGIWPTRD
jgi:microcystin-dependent protein